MAKIYVGSAKYASVAAWAAVTTYSSGDLRRQLSTPAVGSERVFQASGGISGGSEPTWNTGVGATTSDGTVTWTEVTGQAALNGDGGGTAWAAPHARLANAFASGWSVAGDTFYVSNTHNETQATAQSLTAPGTPSNPSYVICVDNATVPPTTVATTGAISPTAAGGSALTLSGYAYYYGLNLNVGTGSSSSTMTCGSTGNALVYDSCTFKLNNTSSSSAYVFGGTSSGKDALAKTINCSFLFGAIGQAITVQDGLLEIVGGSIAASGTVPTTPFRYQAVGKITVRDCDMSAITNSIVTASGTVYGEFLAANCKLHAGVAFSSGSVSSFGAFFGKMHNCDNGATNYHITEQTYAGTLNHETTIVRTGGANNGTTSVSWGIITTANSNWVYPYGAPEIVKWNNTTGTPVTATVEINSNSTLKNDEIWLEIEYLGDAASPLCSTASSRKTDILQAAANVTSSAAAWGGSLTTQQKLQVTFTPQQAGPVKARVKVAKASLTVYVDPLVTIA